MKNIFMFDYIAYITYRSKLNRNKEMTREILGYTSHTLSFVIAIGVTVFLNLILILTLPSYKVFLTMNPFILVLVPGLLFIVLYILMRRLYNNKKMLIIVDKYGEKLSVSLSRIIVMIFAIIFIPFLLFLLFTILYLLFPSSG